MPSKNRFTGKQQLRNNNSSPSDAASVSSSIAFNDNLHHDQEDRFIEQFLQLNQSNNNRNNGNNNNNKHSKTALLFSSLPTTSEQTRKSAKFDNDNDDDDNQKTDKIRQKEHIFLNENANLISNSNITSSAMNRRRGGSNGKQQLRRNDHLIESILPITHSSMNFSDSNVEENNNVNSQSLAEKSTSPFLGKASDKLRRIAWPILLKRTQDAHLTATLRKKMRRQRNQNNIVMNTSESPSLNTSFSSNVIHKLSSTNSSNLLQHENNNNNNSNAKNSTLLDSIGSHATATTTASLSSQSRNNSELLLVPSSALMSIEECDLRIEAFLQLQKEQNSNKSKISAHSSTENVFPFPKNCSPHVVEADINRSLFDFPNGDDLVSALFPGTATKSTNNTQDLDLRQVMRIILKRCLLRVCAADPSLHYYQGLHDIASVVLHVYFDHKLPHIVSSLILLHKQNKEHSNRDTDASPQNELRSSSASASSSTMASLRQNNNNNNNNNNNLISDLCEIDSTLKDLSVLEDRMTKTFSEMARTRLTRFCSSTMADTQMLLIAMHGVLQKVHPKLAKILERNGIAPTWNFALSWLITWFGHDLEHHLGGQSGSNHQPQNVASTTNAILRVIYDFLIRTNENMIAFLCISVLVNFCRIPASGKKSSASSSFDEQRYGKLVPDVEPFDRYTLNDFGMLHTQLKKLPNKLLCVISATATGVSNNNNNNNNTDGETLDERKALEQLDMLIETATRLERAHKELLLYLLEDPMERVVVAMPNLDFDDFDDDDGNDDGDEIEEAQNSTSASHDEGNQGDGTEQQQQNTPAVPPSNSSPSRFSRGLRMFMVLGVFASAAAAQVFLDPQSYGLA